jgi:hypothetical protein
MKPFNDLTGRQFGFLVVAAHLEHMNIADIGKCTALCAAAARSLRHRTSCAVGQRAADALPGQKRASE